MQGVGAVVPMEEPKPQSQVDEVRTGRSFGLIGDVFLMEAIVAAVGQLGREALALGIELVHVEAHAFVQQATHAVALQQTGHLRIVDDVVYFVHKIGLAGL